MPLLALLTIGIDYNGQLHGCVRDSNHIKQYFMARVPLLSCVQMTDNLPMNSILYPSKRNIEAQFLALKTMQNLTHLIVHYSGHGAQTRDRNKDEKDGKDEVLVPVDYASSGCIVDDWLYTNVVSNLKCTTLFIIDACHSGSVLDLRYNWIPARRGGYVRTNNNLLCSEKPNVTLLSGCLDSQYSFETQDATYGISGALTSAFLNTIQTRSSRDPATLLYYIQQRLPTQQTTQISSAQKIITPWSYIP